MAAVASIRRQVQVCIGKAGLPLGSLVYVRQGRRENCAFAYDEVWLANPDRFSVSADLQLMPGYQTRKATSSRDSVASDDLICPSRYLNRQIGFLRSDGGCLSMDASSRDYP